MSKGRDSLWAGLGLIGAVTVAVAICLPEFWSALYSIILIVAMIAAVLGIGCGLGFLLYKVYDFLFGTPAVVVPPAVIAKPVVEVPQPANPFAELPWNPTSEQLTKLDEFYASREDWFLNHPTTPEEDARSAAWRAEKMVALRAEDARWGIVPGHPCYDPKRYE